MKLITTESNMKKLIPEDGMFLTNDEIIADGDVWLGKLDSEENWHEVTAEEKEEILKQQQEEREEREQFRLTTTNLERQ